MNPARPLFSLYGQSMLSVAYFDASTTQKERQFVTISGCLAPAARWKTFESKWQKMLSKAGLLYFHMTDFEAYQGDYKDWTKAVHNHFFKKVARAITGKAKFSLGRGVAHDDFAWAQSRNAKLQGVSAFTFCASQCFHAIAEWATKHTYNGNIAYIFESGDGFEGELLALKTYIESSQDRMNYYRWAGLYILSKIANNPPYPLTPLPAADI
jgi:hypothetical protein